MATDHEDNSGAIGLDAICDHRRKGTIVGRWKPDPRRSSVEFRAKHFWGAMIVKGRFEDYRGYLDLGASPAVELAIDSASVQSGQRKRDQHLRAADFFDVEEHPLIRFTSDSVELRGEALAVHGSLSAGGRSIPLALDASIRRVDGELEISATAAAPHRELGMTFSPLGMIRPQSTLIVRARLVREDAPAARASA